MCVQWKTQDVKIEKNFAGLISNRYLNISIVSIDTREG